jgi:uncharacterized protein YdaU (DUF1376 family)
MHYYQFNIGDYKSHTEHLSEMEDLTYRRLLDWYYLHESPIPLDINETARQIRMRSHSDCIALVLQEYFERTEIGWIHHRADKEIAKTGEKSEKASASAKARWNRAKDANALQTQSESNATHNTEHITQDTKPKVKTQRGSRLPTDWSLPEDWKAWAENERPDLLINKVADSFKDFWISKPGAGGNKLNWEATWRNWIRSQSAPKQAFSNKYDVAHVTTPPPPNQDAALRKIEEDRKKAVPPSLETLAKLAELRKGVQA